MIVYRRSLAAATRTPLTTSRAIFDSTLCPWTKILTSVERHYGASHCLSGGSEHEEEMLRRKNGEVMGIEYHG